MNLNPVYRLYGAVFARPALYKLNRFLYNLSLRGLGILNWENENLQGEVAVLRRVLSHAPSGAVVFDVGANVGKYSEKVLEAAPHVNLHAFEPSPTAFGALQTRLEGKKLECVQSAVGLTNGTAKLYDYVSGDGSGHATLQDNVIERVHGGVSQAVEVPLLRLDTYIAANDIESIYWMKIDVEGREMDVLDGLGSLIEDGFPIRFVQIEFNEMNVLSGTFMEAFCNKLKGYRVYRILPGGRLLEISEEIVTLREIFAFQNLLFCCEENAIDLW